MVNSTNQCILLVVEDNKGDVLLLKRALTMAGIHCQISEARDGQEAMDYLANKASIDQSPMQPTQVLPTHVLLDLKLPRRTGLEVLAWIRSHETLRGLRVIVLTSSDLDFDRDQAQQYGIDAYLVKPMGMSEYVATALKIAEIWGLAHGQTPK